MSLEKVQIIIEKWTKGKAVSLEKVQIIIEKWTDFPEWRVGLYEK